MPRRKFALPAALIALVLEFLPISAVLCFSQPSGEGASGWFRQTFSYFSPFPVGYGNLLPLLTGVCTVLLTALLLLLPQHPRLLRLARLIAMLAAIQALFPLFMGARYLTIPGVCIPLALAYASLCLWCPA